MTRYTFGSSSYSRARLPANDDAAATSTVADAHDPRHLLPAQQIALLTLRKGELAQACISALRAGGAPSPSELDYIALSRASLCIRQSNNRRALTPIGKYRADELARAIAATSDIHVCVYGRTPGAWHVRCSCGFFASNAAAIRDPLTKVMAQATHHLRHVGKLPPAEARDAAKREIFACAADGLAGAPNA
jgi:hypothetical protein